VAGCGDAGKYAQHVLLDVMAASSKTHNSLSSSSSTPVTNWILYAGRRHRPLAPTSVAEPVIAKYRACGKAANDQIQHENESLGLTMPVNVRSYGTLLTGDMTCKPSNSPQRFQCKVALRYPPI
jgi:hypothetical protein